MWSRKPAKQWGGKLVETVPQLRMAEPAGVLNYRILHEVIISWVFSPLLCTNDISLSFVIANTTALEYKGSCEHVTPGGGGGAGCDIRPN